MMEKHWVEDLFPPFFTYSLEKDASTTPGSSSAQDGAKDDEEAKDDLKRIQKLYDRVRIEINRKEKKGQQKCIQVGEPLAEHLPQKSPLDKSTNTIRKKTPSKKRGDDECIWTVEELEILRQATEETKEENFRLKAELSIVSKQNEKYTRKSNRQIVALRAKDAELLERKQEAARLSHRCHHLETELQHSRMIARLLEEDISELQESKKKLKKLLKGAQRELSDEKLARVKLGGELQQIGKKNTLESIIREDEIRLDYERQITRLYEELEGVRVELEKEKKENVSVRKALDHLRIHFASVPSKDPSLQSHPGIGLGKMDLF